MDDSKRGGPDGVPKWLVAVRERMRGEVADLLDEEGRLRWDPDAPDAAETGARILKAFGRAAVDQMAQAVRDRLETRPQGLATSPGIPSDEDFRKDLGEYLQGVLKELLDENRRDPSATGAETRRGSDGTPRTRGRTHRRQS